MTPMKTGAIFLLALVVIVYGSLYPFAFVYRPIDVDLVAHFRASLDQRPGRGDAIANVLLYMPFGLFLAATLARRLPILLAVALTVVAGTLTSIAIEIAQIWDPGRVSSGWDIVTNTLGTTLGALGAGIGWRLLGAGAGRIELADPFAILLVASWLGYRLAPFVPSLDFGNFKNVLKPLLLNPSFGPEEIFRHVVSWLAVGALLRAALPTWRVWLLLAGLFAAVEVGRSLLVGGRIGAPEVIGGIAAIALWPLIGQLFARRPLALAALLATLVVVEGLSPFSFQATQAQFHWIPFYGFLRGSIEVGIQALFQKLFLYGAMIWSLRAACVPTLLAGLLPATLLTAIEVAQLNLPGRVSEITDPLIAVIALGLGLALARRPAPGSAPGR